jgi:bifunctional non-homologous end joining protein LigD
LLATIHSVSLDEYRKKRRPGKTPEPFKRGTSGSERPIFVVQRHAARRLHYDFRLERDGALASWAVPKGIPLRRGERHLAVHVEDHPLESGSFEGAIPAGEYGAGTVEIWDRGWYELVEEKKNGGLTVRLHGERLDGEWALIPAKLDGNPKNWLILRHDETPAGRLRYRPMLSTSAGTLPRGEGWVYEPKWDGYRAIVSVSSGEVTFTSRNGNDLTERFKESARKAELAIRTSDGVLDGEICRLDDQGRSSFSALQSGTGTLVLVLFDVLELDSEPLIQLALVERRKRLEAVVDHSVGGVVVSPQFEDGDALLDAARQQGLEGVVAKRADSEYQPGRRSTDWRKVKVRQSQEVVVVGYTKGQGRRSSGFGSLAVAVHETGGLRWAGNVGTGYTDAEIARLLKLFKPLVRPDSPLAEVPKMPRVRRSDIVWLEPKLVAQVEFVEWTHEGHLRAPVYLGLREDKQASEVRKEREPVPTAFRKGRRELRVSNLDKVFWPDEGITKGDLIAYYRDIAEVLVPHLRGRPFTMKRYPDGWKGKNFFQKQAPSHMPSWIERAPLPASTREGEKKIIEYAVIDDELALLWVVNMGCIDMHVWSARVDKPERPDWVMFDLDPAEGATFDDVVTVARLVKDTLALVELEGYPKTSGSRGIHILVPLARRHTFADARDFASIIAGALARAHPGLVTTEWARKKRVGVLVDANQNRPGATNASVYSVRPRPGAPVSTPLRWEEVVPGLDFTAFTMEAVLDRVARDGDLFAGVLEGKQSLTKALRALK